MKIEKIKPSHIDLDNNFKFYLFLKELNSTQGMPKSKIEKFLELYYSHSAAALDAMIYLFIKEIETIKNEDQKSNLNNLLLYIKDINDLKIFIFSLRLLQIKPLMLEEAKLISTSNLIRLKKMHPLSIAYDRIGKDNAFYTRVNGALISLIFFENIDKKQRNFLSGVTKEYIDSLIEEYYHIKSLKIEANQIFMLMFSESVNQSITSTAGSSYEERILNLLISLGLEDKSISKIHDIADNSTEFDFYFEIDNIKYGIGAKRTLRERYKQFIKTSLTSKIDVIIEITLGLDLTLEKAKTIRQHDTYLFIADEIYNSREYLRDLYGIFPASQLSLNKLKKLGDKEKI